MPVVVWVYSGALIGEIDALFINTQHHRSLLNKSISSISMRGEGAVNILSTCVTQVGISLIILCQLVFL